MTGIEFVVWSTVYLPIAVMLITIKRHTNLLDWGWSEAVLPIFVLLNMAIVISHLIRFVKWTWGVQL